MLLNESWLLEVFTIIFIHVKLHLPAKYKRSLTFISSITEQEPAEHQNMNAVFCVKIDISHAAASGCSSWSPIRLDTVNVYSTIKYC